MVVSYIPARHPAAQNFIDISKYSHLHDVPIPNDQNVMKADILTGMDNAHLLVPNEVKSSPSAKNEPFAMRTYFGWALRGPIFGQSDQAYANSIQGSIEKDFENMWTIEHGVGESSESELSLNDRKVLRFGMNKPYMKTIATLFLYHGTRVGQIYQTMKRKRYTDYIGCTHVLRNQVM